MILAEKGLTFNVNFIVDFAIDDGQDFAVYSTQKSAFLVAFTRISFL